MDWVRVENEWEHLKDKVKQQWGNLTDHDLNRIAGKRPLLVRKIQECYGYERERAEREVDLFFHTLD